MWQKSGYDIETARYVARYLEEAPSIALLVYNINTLLIILIYNIHILYLFQQTSHNANVVWWPIVVEWIGSQSFTHNKRQLKLC